jgi:hypothetical protein
MARVGKAVSQNLALMEHSQALDCLTKSRVPKFPLSPCPTEQRSSSIVCPYAPDSEASGCSQRDAPLRRIC